MHSVENKNKEDMHEHYPCDDEDTEEAVEDEVNGDDVHGDDVHGDEVNRDEVNGQGQDHNRDEGPPLDEGADDKEEKDPSKKETIIEEVMYITDDREEPPASEELAAASEEAAPSSEDIMGRACKHPNDSVRTGKKRDGVEACDGIEARDEQANKKNKVEVQVDQEMHLLLMYAREDANEHEYGAECV